jgi:hypothetical protein
MSEIGVLLFIGQDIGYASASASGYLRRAVIWDRAARSAARRHPPVVARRASGYPATLAWRNRLALGGSRSSRVDMSTPIDSYVVMNLSPRSTP